jgi:hypothetical protein
MDGRHEGDRAPRRTARVLAVTVVLALAALPGLALAAQALGEDEAAVTVAPAVRVVRPAPWQAVRTGTPVDVLAEVAGSGACAVRWDDGTANEVVTARGGYCATSRVPARPGMYTVGVTVTGTDGTRREVRTLVVVHDGRGAVQAAGVTGVSPDGARFAVAAGHVPRTRRPAAAGDGDVVTPGGLRARVATVEWVVVTPERHAAVKGTAVGGDGTAYGFVVYSDDRRSDGPATAGAGGGERAPDRARVVVWPRSGGDHPGARPGTPTRDDRPGTSYDLDLARPAPLADGAVAVTR